jgi:multimeric flavodoxin WrbA
MKVIAIQGSPRINGNSDALCDQFLKGAQEAGCETEKIQIGKEKISPCHACYACRKTGKCIQQDGMDEILDKLILADVILLSTPVYFYSMDAQMKILIDRSLARYQEIKNKTFYFALTAADPNHEAMDATISGLKGYTTCLPGAVVKEVFYGTGAWEKGDILGLPVMKKIYEAGKKLI